MVSNDNKVPPSWPDDQIVTVGEYADSISTIYWSNYLGPGWVMVSYSSPLPTLIINMRLPTRGREISPQCLPRPPSPSQLEMVTLPQSHHLMDTDGVWNMLLLDAGSGYIYCQHETWLVDLHIDNYPLYSTWYSADGLCCIMSRCPCVCSPPQLVSIFTR